MCIPRGAVDVCWSIGSIAFVVDVEGHFMNGSDYTLVTTEGHAWKRRHLARAGSCFARGSLAQRFEKGH